MSEPGVATSRGNICEMIHRDDTLRRSFPGLVSELPEVPRGPSLTVSPWARLVSCLVSGVVHEPARLLLEDDHSIRVHRPRLRVPSGSFVRCRYSRC